MGLITIENMEDGVDASANLWNERFGKITDTINGNIESVNLKNNAVTREKIASGAVTSDKIQLERKTDANGWEYFSFGDFRVYTKTVVNNESPYKLARDDYRYERSQTDMPVGIGRSQVHWMGCTYTSGIQFLPKPYYMSDTKLATMIWNVGPDETINFTAQYMLWVKA